MLVLSRMHDESIVIGEGENQVIMTIVDIRGDKVRVGLTGRKDIPIHRQEVYNKIHADTEVETKPEPENETPDEKIKRMFREKKAAGN